MLSSRIDKTKEVNHGPRGKVLRKTQKPHQSFVSGRDKAAAVR
jgi:hypothetical protein